MKLAIILFTVILSSCNNIKQTELKNFNLTIYKNMGKGYVFSNDVIHFNENDYKPISTSCYQNNTLNFVYTYGSDGVISHSLNEIIEDTLFARNLKIQNRMNISYLDSNLNINSNFYKIKFMTPDSIIALNKDTLFKVILTSNN